MRKWSLLVLAAVLLYVPFFPERTSAELTLLPRWVVDPHEATSAVISDSLIPYRTENEFGYIDSEGRVARVESILYGVAIDAKGYINYSSIGTDLVFQLPDGAMSSPLDTQGYPMFLDGGLFIISTNRTRIEEWATDGAMLWNREFGSLVTSFDVRGDYIVVGLLDGRVQLCDRSGNLLFDQRLSDTRVDIVYGCTVDEKGGIVVVAHGLDPQLLTVFEFREGVYSRAGSQPLEHQFRTNRLLFLAPDNRIVFVEEPDGILAYQIENGSSSEIELGGTLVEYDRFGTEPYYWFAAKQGSETTLAVVTTRGVPIYLEKIGQRFVRGVALDSRLYFGMGDRIASIGMTLR